MNTRFQVVAVLRYPSAYCGKRDDNLLRALAVEWVVGFVGILGHMNRAIGIPGPMGMINLLFVGILVGRLFFEVPVHHLLGKHGWHQAAQILYELPLLFGIHRPLSGPVEKDADAACFRLRDLFQADVGKLGTSRHGSSILRSIVEMDLGFAWRRDAEYDFVRAPGIGRFEEFPADHSRGSINQDETAGLRAGT